MYRAALTTIATIAALSAVAGNAAAATPIHHEPLHHVWEDGALPALVDQPLDIRLELRDAGNARRTAVSRAKTRLRGTTSASGAPR